MPNFNAPIPGATTVIAELELRNNPDLPVVDTTKVRGGAHFVATNDQRDLIPLSLRKQGTTRAYVANEDKFYFLPQGIENYHWQVESGGNGVSTASMTSDDRYMLGRAQDGSLLLVPFGDDDATGLAKLVNTGGTQPGLGYFLQKGNDGRFTLVTNPFDLSTLANILNNKSDKGHGHAISDVTGLPEALAGKAAATHTHESSQLAGGSLFVADIAQRDAIPPLLRRQGTTRVYVQSESKFYFLKTGVANSDWSIEYDAPNYSGIQEGISYVFTRVNGVLSFTPYAVQAGGAVSLDELTNVDFSTVVKNQRFFLTKNEQNKYVAVAVSLEISEVQGLVEALSNRALLGHTHNAATTLANGFMSSTDKVKLNGIENEANKYVHPITEGNGHVPPSNLGAIRKFLRDGATAGAYSWEYVKWAELAQKPPVMEGKKTVISNLDTEGFLSGMYRVEAGQGVFPVVNNTSGPAGAYAKGTLVTSYADTLGTWVLTQMYFPATDLGAAGTKIKNVYTRSREMYFPNISPEVFTGTPWRMIPFSDNIMSALLQSGVYQVAPGTAFSITYPHTNITAANPPFTITQVLTHPWITATLNSSNVLLTGITPAYEAADSKNNSVLMKVRDALGVETVFSLTVRVEQPPAPQFDGSANIDVSFPDTADYALRLQCVTPGTTVTNLSMKPQTNGLRYLRPVNSLEVDPANLYGLAITGKANTANAQIKNYRFGLNLAKIRTDYPALPSIKFDLYAGLKSGYAVDLFLITLNRALGGSLATDPAAIAPMDWKSTGIDSNPGGTAYPPNPNYTNMFIAGANDPAERKVATLEYFLATNVWQIDYLAQVTMTGSLWDEASGFKVSNLANNGQYYFPSLFDFYFDVKGLHDEVLGSITRPDGQTYTWGPIPVNSGQALNSGIYQARDNGTEARQYGTYAISFKTRYKGAEKGVLSLNVVSKAPYVPTTYVIEPQLRDESVQPNTTIMLTNGQEYDVPATFDVGWQVTGPHDHVSASVTRPNGEIFTWGPETVGQPGAPATSANYQMAGFLSETRQYGSYVYVLKLRLDGVERVVSTTSFVSRQPIIIPPVSSGSYTPQITQRGNPDFMDIQITQGATAGTYNITDAKVRTPPDGHHWWYWVGSKVVRTNTRLQAEPWNGSQPGHVTKMAIKSNITLPSQLNLGVTTADFQQVGAFIEGGDVGGIVAFFFKEDIS